jgi:hypothetical protein
MTQLTLLYRLDGHEKGHGDTLPEREEEDALDAEEFGYPHISPCTADYRQRDVRTGRNGLRSVETQTQNMARQLVLSAGSVEGGVDLL